MNRSVKSMKGKVFTAQEVQAMLNKSKVMFREVIKNANYDSPVHSYKDWENNGLFYPVGTLVDEDGTQTETQYSFDAIKCPYQVGQKIFCKEKFLQKLGSTQLPSGEHETFFIGSEVEYVADGAQERWDNPNVCYPNWWKKRPAQHMKQEHSRLALLIKEIGVERLADISKEDAIKEGMFFTDYGKKCYHKGYQDIKKCPSTVGHQNQEDGWNWKENKSPSECLGSAYWAFANYWNATHKKPEEKFEASPFVWKVEFEVINN